MNKFVTWIVLPGVVVASIGAAGAAWLWFDLQDNLDRRIFLHESSELFEIPRGSSLANLAQRLEQRGWLRHPLYLRLEARRLGVAGKLQAGLYEISNGTSVRALLTQFVRGDVKVFQITFVEGTTFRDMREKLSQHRYLARSSETLDDSALMARCAPDIEHPEGWFFPSTYYFSSGADDVEILKRAHVRMRREVDAAWSRRAAELPYKSPKDVLIMASIIEKETGRADERRAIAGVFVRRLKRGMKLQTDPTVIYGLGEAFDGDLRRADLLADTPYNTYTRHGLPPTPIAMPGAAAIDAAVNPADGDALYFVAKGDGSHAFSRTLTEHNSAVRRFQLSGRE